MIHEEKWYICDRCGERIENLVEDVLNVPDVFSNFAIRMTKGNRVAKAEAIHNPFRGGYGYGY